MFELVQSSSPCQAAVRHSRGLACRTVIIVMMTTIFLWSLTANADVLSYTFDRDIQAFSNAGFVILDNAGHTKLSFTTTQPNQRVVIFFNAMCSLNANTNSEGSQFANIRILVDPAGPAAEFIVPPTDAGSGYICVEAPPTTNPSEDATQTIMVGVSVRPAQAGTNTVRVLVLPDFNSPSSPTQLFIFSVAMTIMR
jgi:hypothetical protein